MEAADTQDGAMMPCIRSLLEVLHEDVMLRICGFLPVTPLLSLQRGCDELHTRVQGSVDLWQGLCKFFLGEACLALHESRWDRSANDRRGGNFYYQLFKASWICQDFYYDHELQQQFLHSGPGERQNEEQLQTSGHTSEAIGPFVLQLGGMRSSRRNEPMHVSVFDVMGTRLFMPAVAEDSACPPQRLRHASCVVHAPRSLPHAAFPETILVLGGYAGNMLSPFRGQPLDGLNLLLFLQITRSDASEIRWHEVEAAGSAPRNIYHHACAAFAGGRKVCVFGGDIPEDDQEFLRIEFREGAAFVYILDVDALTWQVVRTGGAYPVWRSFPAAASHTSLHDGREYLVIFGGTEEPCDPWAWGEAASMCGYELDLNTYQWRCGPENGFMPSGRLRFGTARWGRHLLIHGGFSEGPQRGVFHKVVRLNLTTLSWANVNFLNDAPHPLRRLYFENGAPQAGIVVGAIGPNKHLIPRLVVFRLNDPLEEQEPETASEYEEPVRVHLPTPMEVPSWEWQRAQAIARVEAMDQFTL